MVHWTMFWSGQCQGESLSQRPAPRCHACLPTHSDGSASAEYHLRRCWGWQGPGRPVQERAHRFRLHPGQKKRSYSRPILCQYFQIKKEVLRGYKRQGLWRKSTDRRQIGDHASPTVRSEQSWVLICLWFHSYLWSTWSIQIGSKDFTLQREYMDRFKFCPYSWACK